MDLNSLVMAHVQCPLYLIPLGSYFTIDFPIQNYSDIMQKNHECPAWTEQEDEIYVGANVNYMLTSKSLVTPIDYNGRYWYPGEY
jgi:hypothetical protein